MGRDGLAALGAGLALLAILLATAAVLRDRLLAAFGSDLPRLLGVDAGAALATSLRSGAVALAFAAVASLALLASARSRGAARLAAALGAALLAVHAGLESWKVAPVAPAAELRRTPALLTRLAPAAHVEDGQPPRILRSPLVDGELPPRLRAGYRQETLVLDAPGRWGVAAVPGFEGWRSCAFADLWPAAAGMRLDVFQTLYAIDAVALPRDVCAVPRAERPGRRRPRAAHARHRRGGRPRDAFGWTLVRSEGIRPRAFVAPRWRWAAPAAALPAVLDPARGEDAGLVVVSGDGADPSPPEREALPLGACTIEGYRPERVALSCTSRADGHAVLVEENAPGWTATADGAPAPVLTADVLLRAVRVGPGRHAVVFLLPHAVAPRGRRRVRRRVARLDRAGGPRWGAPGPRERRR